MKKYTFRIIIIHKSRNVEFEFYDLNSRNSIVKKLKHTYRQAIEGGYPGLFPLENSRTETIGVLFKCEQMLQTWILVDTLYLFIYGLFNYVSQNIASNNRMTGENELNYEMKQSCVFWGNIPPFFLRDGVNHERVRVVVMRAFPVINVFM